MVAQRLAKTVEAMRGVAGTAGARDSQKLHRQGKSPQPKPLAVLWQKTAVVGLRCVALT